MPRKKTRKVLFIFIALILAVTIVIFINVLPLLLMKPAQTGKIDGTEILAVNNRINSLYLVDSDEGYILFDAGQNAAAVEKAFEEIAVDPSDVKFVFLTHSDSDHVRGLPLFVNAEIYMGEDELQMLDGTTKRNRFSSNSMPEGIPAAKPILLTDRQKLDLGGHTVECIKTPGHTPGSAAYLLDGRFLFTGDALKVVSGVMDVHPFTMNIKTAEESIQALRESIGSYSLVLTAHYGYHDVNELERR